jgi:hypothetical protein
MPSDAFRALFDRHAAYVLERQLLFEKEVAGQPWEADVEEGLLVVGARRARVEVLATYSSQSQTLLWSWGRAGPSRRPAQPPDCAISGPGLPSSSPG